jgi:hypothetical protein
MPSSFFLLSIPQAHKTTSPLNPIFPYSHNPSTHGFTAMLRGGSLPKPPETNPQPKLKPLTFQKNPQNGWLDGWMDEWILTKDHNHRAISFFPH